MRLGDVRAIVAPSNCHHLFIADAQRAFAGVPTYAIHGLESKRKDLALMLAWDFDRMLIAHGEPFTHDAKDALREAWSFVV